MSNEDLPQPQQAHVYVSLRDYMDVLREADKRWIEAEFRAREVAVKIALDAATDRNSGTGQMWKFFFTAVGAGAAAYMVFHK